MSNLQVADSTLDLPPNHPCHDSLFKVRPFMDMLQKFFKKVLQAWEGPKL